MANPQICRTEAGEEDVVTVKWEPPLFGENASNYDVSCYDVIVRRHDQEIKRFRIKNEVEEVLSKDIPLELGGVIG